MESLENYDSTSVDYNVNDIELLKTIFDDYPDGFVFKDKNLQYLYANKSFYDFFGISTPYKLAGNSFFPYINESNQKLIYEAGKTVANTKKPLNYVLNIKDMEGNDVVLNVITSPYIYRNEFFGVLSIIKDITSEEDLKEKFVLKHVQLRSLIENLPLLIYMQDKDGNYLIGTEFSKRFVDDGYDSFNNIKFNPKFLDDENKDVFEKNKLLKFERKILDINSEPHWYQIYKVPISDYKGRITGVLTVANNIDCEKNLEAQKETFVATLGHDLKNPTIAQIRGLELLLKGDFGEISAEQREILEMVLDSCRYMNGMLSSLLATYRNHSGVIKLQIEEISFSSLITECVSEMEYVAKDKGVEIFITKNLGCDCVNADRVQLKRVVMNLLSNAIKYAFKNTIIELRLSLDVDMFTLELENDSPYIPEKQRALIFGRYVSYASTLHELGNGLGLYTSQKIINSHNGEMFVESFEDNKNIFGFRIPKKPKIDNLIKDIKF